MNKYKNIIILGTGAWGTAFALLLNHKNLNIYLWGRRDDYVNYIKQKRENVEHLPCVKIPHLINFIKTSDLPDVLTQTHLIISAIPTQYIRNTFSLLIKKIDFRNIPIVSLAKGIELDTFKTPTEVIKEVIQREDDNILALSGPSHSEEIAKQLPASVVIASTNKTLAKELQMTFQTPFFRVYTNSDIKGTELCGALKNVIAIASGISDGLGLGDNAKAALITRGLVEMIRFGKYFNAKPVTFFGLAGIGDLITTCMSPFGRNRSLGFQLGKGKKLQEILDNTTSVVEGISTTKAVMNISRQEDIDMPITHGVYQVLFENIHPHDVVKSLMQRTLKDEDIDTYN